MVNNTIGKYLKDFSVYVPSMFLIVRTVISVYFFALFLVILGNVGLVNSFIHGAAISTTDSILMFWRELLAPLSSVSEQFGNIAKLREEISDMRDHVDIKNSEISDLNKSIEDLKEDNRNLRSEIKSRDMLDSDAGKHNWMLYAGIFATLVVSLVLLSKVADNSSIDVETQAGLSNVYSAIVGLRNAQMRSNDQSSTIDRSNISSDAFIRVMNDIDSTNVIASG